MYRFVISGKKYIKMLSSLEFKKQTVRDLSKTFAVYYQHLCTVMAQFQREKLVSKEQKKNKILFSLTPYGKRVVTAFEQLEQVIAGTEAKAVPAEELPNNVPATEPIDLGGEPDGI